MINTVLFDLDGTIIDTNELIISSFLDVLGRHYPNEVYTRERIIPHMGATLEAQLRIFSGREDVTDLVKDYRTYNNAHHDEMVRQFPHVLEVMDTLYHRGVTLGVVTTKIQSTAMRSLETLGLLKYMAAIVTVEDVEHPKPHPEPVLTAVQRLYADPSRTIMVGDSGADIQAANTAGVKSAGVAWSLKGVEVLQKYNPDYILNDMRDIYSVLGWESVNR